MPKYRYTAVSIKGETVTGEHTSPDQAGVADMLRQGGYFPSKIVQIGADASKTRRKVPIKVLSGFCSQLATLMRAGVNISKSLEILTLQQENKTFRIILADVYASVQRGLGLSEAFEPYQNNFPPLFSNMLEAGEESGTLDSCMERAGSSFTRISKLNSKAKNAMIYPMIIVVVMLGLIALMLLVVLPQFSEMYADAGTELPAITEMLLSTSDLVRERWFIFLGVIAAIVFGTKAWLDSDRGRTAFDKFKLGLPVVSKLLGKIYAARFCRTLASLGSAGVPLTTSIAVTARSVLNRLVEKELYKVVDGINRGELLSNQLEKMNLLPPMIVHMVRLGEETGTMEELLIQAADYYDEEADSAMQALTAMLEPLMIIIMAIIIVPILLGVLMPMFNMAGAMV